MLDDDDVEFTALMWPDGGGWILGIIGIFVIVVMLFVVSGNHKDCESKHCDHGKPMLMNNECLCVEKAE